MASGSGRPLLNVSQRDQIGPEAGANSLTSISNSQLAVEIAKVSLDSGDRQANFARDPLC